MNRIKDKREYKQRGIIYLPEHVNTLKMHSNETLDHWIAKALVFRILRKLKHDIVTEFEITGMGVGDVLDLTTSVQYEIETISYPKYIRDRAEQYTRIGVEVIVIPIRKLPDDIKEREKALMEYVWE
ncbi:MAG: hypothetical protein Q7J68_00830 [Thermoplasmata archaeon]|nr:hypothetical protein [Thermoplasmata archaeon]